MGDTQVPKVKVSENGPYLVSGNLPLSKEVIVSDDAGNSVDLKVSEKYPAKETYALCRCGGSKDKPYCDGTHLKIKFKGAETASRKKYSEQAELIEGPKINLMDAENLCAGVRFCHNKKGNVWDLVKNSDDSSSRKTAIEQACNCLSGRLTAVDKKADALLEPKFNPEVSLIEDPAKSVSGPICVKGGVYIESSDSKTYELRNRVTLCRCGKSKNKPFCDSTHIAVGFSDGEVSISKRAKSD
jgi:CDGSH-type Zn-finger protein